MKTEKDDRPVCTDWNLYGNVTHKDWRQGDEPDVGSYLLIDYKGSLTKVPLPEGAKITLHGRT